MAQTGVRAMTRRSWAIVGLIVLAVLVVLLSAFALLRDDTPDNPAPGGPGGPVGTPTTPSATPAPTPTPTVTPAARADQRFIIATTDALWRATAGSCGTVEPLVQRSIDSGKTWKDITPRYRGIAQVASLDPLGKDGAEMVAALGADCTPTGLRSFTAGKYWEPNSKSLDPARYLALDDAAKIVSPGDDFAAPCPDARGLRAAGSVITVLCDGDAYVRSGDTWTKLDAPGAVALGISGTDIVVAQSGVTGCDGVAIALFSGSDGTGTSIGCASRASTTGPVAIAASTSATYVWSGDAVTRVAR
ncbi:hypothetical protein GCM10022240_14670 [Microbacterium kribbense]|uniref:Uncharacterized protein n=1 Tax=Microbacterium kribbense TaxID=433645 RepID=A0ABP7GGP3_9MICO